MSKKPRNRKLWSNGDLPDDVWLEILSRLPVKTLVKFRSVSKPWRTIIEDPDFARFHLTRFSNNRLETNLLVVQGIYPREYVLRCSKTLKLTSRLSFGPLHTDPVRWNIVNSIDGLVMLETVMQNGHDLLLWNPSIRKTLILPSSPEIFIKMGHHEFGLGFDSLIKDYKYVRVWTNNLWTVPNVCFIQVYTLGTNSWKTIEFHCEDFFNSFGFRYPHGAICCRGVIYALALEMVSFNFSNEMFDSTKLPTVGDAFNSCQALTMTDDRCSLAFVNLTKDEGSIWVLQYLGPDIKSSSWILRYTFSTTAPIEKTRHGVRELFYLKKNGEMFLKTRVRVTSYDLETQKEKVLLKKTLHETWAYMESLILLTKITHV